MSRPQEERINLQRIAHYYADDEVEMPKNVKRLARAYLALSSRVEEIIARMNRENADRGEESVRDERKRLYTLLSDIREIATGDRAALSEASHES